MRPPCRSALTRAKVVRAQRTEGASVHLAAHRRWRDTPYALTSTPFQKATRSVICLAASFGSG
jgi:hypothetical protein